MGATQQADGESEGNSQFKINSEFLDDFFSLKLEGWYKFLDEKDQYYSYYKKTEKKIKQELYNNAQLFNINEKTIFVELDMHQEAGFFPNKPSYMKLELLFKLNTSQNEFNQEAFIKNMTDILKSRQKFVFAKTKKF